QIRQIPGHSVRRPVTPSDALSLRQTPCHSVRCTATPSDARSLLQIPGHSVRCPVTQLFRQMLIYKSASRSE
ncbi:hypothetical protein LSAT2_006061, partial [Lamellibrachia satsuma]